MSVQKTHLIVTGVARSGTTALAELLNAHEQICIGIERFKFQYLLQNNYAPTLFEKNRFFDFRKEDTNLRPQIRPHWQGVYDTIAEKWDAATLVGDKVPDLTPVLRAFIQSNPDYKYIYILRNLKDVGLSWQARANRTRDAWPAGKGFVEACTSWAEQQIDLHRLIDDTELGAKILLLDYDQMYAPGNQTVQALRAFLGVDHSDVFHETFARHIDFATKKPLRKVPPKFVKAYKAIDMTPARSLRKQAARQMIHWAGKAQTSPVS